MLRDQRQNPETCRVGLKWDKEDMDKLLDMVKENVTYDEMAKVLQRTSGSIKTRLIVTAIRKMEDDEITMEDAAKMFNLDPVDITDYNTKKDEREARRNSAQKSPKKPKVVTNNQIYELLLKIHTKMQLLCDK